MTRPQPPERWKLSARCPKCGRAEGRRVFRWTVDSYSADDPELPVEEVECFCRQRYTVRARHYQSATLDEGRRPV